MFIVKSSSSCTLDELEDLICVWQYDNLFDFYFNDLPDVEKPDPNDPCCNNNLSIFEDKIISRFSDMKIFKDDTNELYLNFELSDEVNNICVKFSDLSSIFNVNNTSNLNNFNNNCNNEILEDVNYDELNNSMVFKNYENLNLCKTDSFNIHDTIDLNEDRALKFRKRAVKSHSGDIWIKIAIWNLQSLNQKIKQRYLKLEFIRDFFNENKFDILWLIDVNDTDTIIINGFKKYTDNRSILFVKDSIESEFTVSKNLIFSELSKLAFIYITPASNDVILKDNFRKLTKLNYSIFGDFNLKSNKDINAYVHHFVGEDSLQIGAIANKLVKSYSFAAPSDHRLVVCEIKAFCKFNVSLRVTKIDNNEIQDNINRIIDGEIPNFKPKVKFGQSYFGLNDREYTINQMINDYLKNNVSKVYKKYNYLWKYDRREPFLGKKVCDGVKVSYGKHLKEDNLKEYRDCENMILSENVYKNLAVRFSRSKAMNDDFVALNDICKATNIKLLDKDTDRVMVLNNIIKVVNKLKKVLNAETFFLQKNKTITDFNDVRVIIIIPTLVKMYESLTYNIVSEYISELFNNNKTKYQFGAIKGGSTFKAMIDLRVKMNNYGNKGVLFLDISKGYDNVDFDILTKAINEIKDSDVRQILKNWANMVYNIDVIVNDEKIKRTRGIPMGLSFSPLLFILYVDFILKDVNKDKLVMYIDDLAVILDLGLPPEDNLEFVLDIIKKLEDASLVTNKKKTVVITAEENLKKVFSDTFPIVNKEKYLGRLIGLNGDGSITNDDRFYNLNAFRTNAFPYWTHFFIKRLIGISALDAKLRFRLMMWSTSDPAIRTAIWRHNWNFFKKGMGIYSYTQMIFSSFNLFRYFIDPVDIINWNNKWKNGTSLNVIHDEIKNKLKVLVKDDNDHGMLIINEAIDNLNINLNLGFNPEDDMFEFNNFFLNKLWKDFQDNILQIYLNEKNEANEPVYNNIRKILKSKLFNHSGIIQKVVFKHVNINKKLKKKQLLEIIVLDNILNEINNKLPKKRDFNIDNCFIMNDNYDSDSLLNMDNDAFFTLCKEKYKDLWKLIDEILKIYKFAKFKTDKTAQLEAQIDKFNHVIFVDGSCVKDTNADNYGSVGYGIYIIDKITDMEYEVYNKVNDDKFQKLENVGGELFGTLRAIEVAINKGFLNVVVCYDYLGIEMYANGSWHTDNKAILEYIYMMQKFRKNIDINFIKVPAHAGINGNERADKLAKMAVGVKDNINPIKEKSKLISDEEHLYYANFYKAIVKCLIILEMVELNANLNDLSLVELMFNSKVKLFNLNSFLEKNIHLMQEFDHDPIDLEYNDLLLD